MMVAIVDRSGVSFAPGKTEYFVTGEDLSKLTKEETARTSLLDALQVNKILLMPLGVLDGECYRDVNPKVEKVAVSPVLDYFARV